MLKNLHCLMTINVENRSTVEALQALASHVKGVVCHDKPKSLKQVVTVPLPNVRKEM